MVTLKNMQHFVLGNISATTGPIFPKIQMFQMKMPSIARMEEDVKCLSNLSKILDLTC